MSSVVVGMREPLRIALATDPRRRPRALRGRSRPGQDAGRPQHRHRGRPRLPSAAVHARPPPVGHHRFVRLRAEHGRVRVPSRPCVHGPLPRGRDQPHLAEDAVGAAGGDGRRAGVRGGPQLPAARRPSTSSRPRTRSSRRARTRCPRRNSTASWCASSVGYPDEAARVARPPRARRAPPRGRDDRAGHRRGDPARRCRRGSRRSTSTRTSSRTACSLAAATRHHRSVEVGASPRGSQGLLLVARALAVLDGRDFVIPDDVKARRRAGARAPADADRPGVDQRRARRRRWCWRRSAPWRDRPRWAPRSGRRRRDDERPDDHTRRLDPQPGARRSRGRRHRGDRRRVRDDARRARVGRCSAAAGGGPELGSAPEPTHRARRERSRAALCRRRHRGGYLGRLRGRRAPRCRRRDEPDRLPSRSSHRASRRPAAPARARGCRAGGCGAHPGHRRPACPGRCPSCTPGRSGSRRSRPGPSARTRPGSAARATRPSSSGSCGRAV